MFDNPNHVIAKQRMLQADLRPVYQRGPRAGLYFKVKKGLFVGLLGLTIVNFPFLVMGKKGEPKE